MNPYWGHHFFGFFKVLFSRIKQGLEGDLSWQDLATDELQILILLLIASSSALVGVFLVLRKMTMLANSLSHTILLGIVVTAISTKQLQEPHSTLTSLVLASLITSLLTIFTTNWIHKNLRLQKDASISLVFTTLFALGVMGASLFLRNTHLGVEAIMGNIDALHPKDLEFAFFLFLFNLSILFIFYKRYALITFDMTLAQNFSLPLSCLNHLLMGQTAATAIGAFRAVGAFLFLSLLVLPPLTARFFTQRLKPLIIISCLIGSFSSVLAVAFSRHALSAYQLSFSTSGMTTITLTLFFIIGIGYRFLLSPLKLRLSELFVNKPRKLQKSK